jgi:hypothetical protein
VVAAYRDAGYDFIALSDHFEERYGWRITDTSELRANDFTAIVAAELSSGPWSDRTTYWVAALGLPLDFESPPAGDPAEAIGRAQDAGAFVVLLHPGLNNLPLEVVARLPGFDTVDAVEIYNHNTFHSQPDRADGAYMVDGLLERGHRISITAGDDAHFEYPGDRFGGWVEVGPNRSNRPRCWPASRRARTTRLRDRRSNAWTATANSCTSRPAERTQLPSAAPATVGSRRRRCSTSTVAWSAKGRLTCRRSVGPIAV